MAGSTAIYVTYPYTTIIKTYEGVTTQLDQKSEQQEELILHWNLSITYTQLRLKLFDD